MTDEIEAVAKALHEIECPHGGHVDGWVAHEDDAKYILSRLAQVHI